LNAMASEQLEFLLEEGIRLQQNGDAVAATDCYQRVLTIDPTNYDALQLLGLGELQAGNLEAGIALLERSLASEPRQVGTLYNLGTALRNVGRPTQAITAFRRVLEFDPVHTLALISLSQVLLLGGDFRETAGLLARALKADERNPELYVCIGHLLRAVGRPKEAAANFRHALSLEPTLVNAFGALGIALFQAGDDSGALEALRSAEALVPSLNARVFRAHAALRLVEWQDWARDLATLAAVNFEHESIADPLRLMYLPVSGEELRQVAERVCTGIAASARSLPSGSTASASTGKPRIRLAYLSPDFRNHAVGNIVAEVFALRDAARFEVFAYGWGPPDNGSTRERIKQACDEFHEVTSLTDYDLAQKLHADGIDIAIDLAGHTAFCRSALWASRAVALQVCWLGYPGTTGGRYMDYLISDHFTVPDGADKYYTEQVVRLPDTYLPYDRSRTVADPRSRAEYGLPEEATVLGCFGQVCKINPLVFDVWMAVLRAAPAAVLWLSDANQAATANLRREAEARGVAAGRLVFSSPIPNSAEHLARYRAMDLALDTFPYGSHSTAADVLWAGCPLVAVVGETFVSRVSGSVLRAAGFGELVAGSLPEYQNLIQALVQDAPRRNALRARLEQTRPQCRLFDMPRFVRALEHAYLAMWSRHERGETPAAFSVPADFDQSESPLSLR
jgi:protein O-GlcNAc transferase